MADRRYTEKAGLKIASPIYSLMQELLPSSGVREEFFYNGLAEIVQEFSARNQALLKKRDTIQTNIDNWHKTRIKEGRPFIQKEYENFLHEIGYIAKRPGNFKIATQNLDAEITTLAGPQLVAPVANDQLASNAANARWVSLWGSIINSNIIPNEGALARGDKYNPARGVEVIKFTEKLLDDAFKLRDASHADVERYSVEQTMAGNRLKAHLKDGRVTELVSSQQFAGHKGEPEQPNTILLENNGLHIEFNIDWNGDIGKTHHAHIQDIKIESALTTIMDLEDSVAIVDAVDKAEAYRNMRSLLDGSMVARWKNAEGQILPPRRVVDTARTYLGPDNTEKTLANRSLMLFRSVGLFMPPNDSIKGQDQKFAPEGILDAVMTALIAKRDLDTRENSKNGSIYIVMPKMHGPEEVQFACDLFARVEYLLGLKRNTLKMGIMDEERRTSVNLKACIAVAKDRVFFVNTGFLDRTGDEYRTSMYAGTLEDKRKMRGADWFDPYEKSNVDTALRARASRKMQVGKGMWAEPNNLLGMYNTKAGQLEAGATTAWVPSPSAAAIHAMHYLTRDVIGDRHPELMKRTRGQVRANYSKILQIPLTNREKITDEQRLSNLDENVQGILGYSARWVKLGIGCSSVPNLAGTNLMEDCATVRISVMNVANWRLNKIYSKEEIEASLKRMAAKVDEQNAGTENYRSMASNLVNDNAINAARELLLHGEKLPNGYVQPVLSKYRKLEKRQFGALADPKWRAPELRAA